MAKRKYYFDYLRIICAFGVILGHVCDDFWSYGDVNGYSWKVFTAFLTPCQSTVPVFFMISGALFLDNNKPLGLKKLYTKYIPRMLSVFFGWSVLYAVASKPASLGAFLEKVFSGHYHMWFILALIGCYLVVPFLRKITESEELTKYFLLLSFIFMTFINYTLPLLTGESLGIVSSGVKLVGKFTSGLSVKMVIGYPFYMVMGYYLSKKEFSKKAQYCLLGAGVLSYIVMIAGTIWWSVEAQQPVNSFQKKNCLPMVILAMALFVFGKYILSRIVPGEKTAVWVQRLSKYTFGVYLVHVFVLDFAEKQLGFTALSFNPLVAAPCLTVLVYITSILISAVLNKIPFINKYLL